MGGEAWTNLPCHILVQIFSYVSQSDRLNLSLVCRSWSEIFHDSQLWSSFTFKFDSEKDKEGTALVCSERYGAELKDIDILVNQSQPVNRDMALTVLERLTKLDTWKIIRIKFGFTHSNPLCFNGKDILDKLKQFLCSVKDKERIFELNIIDLSTLSIVLDNSLLDILSTHHKYLKVVHIQNQCLVDNITESGLLKLVSSCVFLEELYTFFHCVTDDVISVLAGENRVPVKILSLMCNRSDKFKSLVSSEAWESLSNSSPNIELIMKFHHTMPRHIINSILCSKIPATKVDLHLYAWVHEQISHISEVCENTLKYLSCHTSLDPNSTANEELPPALLELVSRCSRLEELHCHCILPKSTVDTITAIANLKDMTLYSERIPGR